MGVLLFVVILGIFDNCASGGNTIQGSVTVFITLVTELILKANLSSS